MEKRVRGVTRAFEVKKRVKEGKRIGGVMIRKEMHLPVGPSEKIFKMEIGVLTRFFALSEIFYWKDMTEKKNCL